MLKKSARFVKKFANAISPQKSDVTRIVIKFDVGFNNAVFIRGKGPGLSWDKGTKLKNNGPDEWVWETTAPFNDCEFKVLINDKQYEAGENHHLSNGSAIKYTPRFG